MPKISKFDDDLKFFEKQFGLFFSRMGIFYFWCSLACLCTVVLISDENGAYYWHVRSGTIQREAPIASPVDIHSPKDATSFSSVSVTMYLL